MVFVYTPEYIKGMDLIQNKKDIIALYTKLSIKYKIPFYDYSNDALSMNQSNFYNSLHLNKSGSEQFTRKLAAKLKANDAKLFAPEN